MGILKKIFTAIRGGTRETGEAIIDANAIRIFEQEINDAENHLEKAKRDLTDVMAKEIQAKRIIKELSAEITKHEDYVAQALKKGEEALALEIATKIAEFETKREVQNKAQDSFSAHSARLKDMIKKAKDSVADMKRQLTMVKATDRVQKASQSISDNYASTDSKLLDAKESLGRIQERQADLEDRLVASTQLENELEGTNIEEKLKASGIGEASDSAQDILARIKEKNNV